MVIIPNPNLCQKLSRFVRVALFFLHQIFAQFVSLSRQLLEADVFGEVMGRWETGTFAKKGLVGCDGNFRLGYKGRDGQGR